MMAAAIADRLVTETMRRSIPLSVQLDLTMRCNERCVHCYRVVEARPELATEEIERVLAELAAAGTLYLTLSGGEVFLRRDLDRLIAHAKRLRFDVRLKSNALLVDAARASRLRDLGVRQVDVSLYSADAAVHDRITGVGGSWTRTLEGVRHLRDAGLRVKLACPLMAANVAGYREVRRLAAELGVAWVFDPMVTARNDGDRSTVRLRISPAALREVLVDPDLVAGTTGTGESTTPGGEATDIEEIPCGASHNACYIGAYGDVTPCVAMPLVCGNVRDEPFEAIWRRSTRMLDVRSIRVRDLPVCASCAIAPHCSRCPGQALVEDGDVRAPSSAACEHATVAARLAGSSAMPPIAWATPIP